MGVTVSRRTFVSSAALGTAGIACAGAGSIAHSAIAQEGSASAARDASSSASEASATSGETTSTIATNDAAFDAVVEPGNTTYGAQINPQADAHMATTDYSALFQPLTLAGKTMKNRIAKSAAGSETQHSTDWPSDTSLAYYEQFAKGGVGMICFETSDVFGSGLSASAVMGGEDAPAGEGDSNDLPEIDSASLDLSTDDGIPAHAAIADAMHQYDTLILGQMMDMMMATGSSASTSSSDELEPTVGIGAGHMQTTEEVQAEIQKFIDGGERYYKAGFDGVELNASCNHYFPPTSRASPTPSEMTSTPAQRSRTAAVCSPRSSRASASAWARTSSSRCSTPASKNASTTWARRRAAPPLTRRARWPSSSRPPVPPACTSAARHTATTAPASCPTSFTCMSMARAATAASSTTASTSAGWSTGRTTATAA